MSFTLFALIAIVSAGIACLLNLDLLAELRETHRSANAPPDSQADE